MVTALAARTPFPLLTAAYRPIAMRFPLAALGILFFYINLHVVVVDGRRGNVIEVTLPVLQLLPLARAPSKANESMMCAIPTDDAIAHASLCQPLPGSPLPSVETTSSPTTFSPVQYADYLLSSIIFLKVQCVLTLARLFSCCS